MDINKIKEEYNKIFPNLNDSTKEGGYDAKQYVLDFWLSKLQQRDAELVEKIEKVKRAVQEATGSFKYDSCYDDIINLIKNNDL